MKIEIKKPTLSALQEDKEAVIGPWKMIWIRLRENKMALTGLIIMGVIIFISVFAPFLTPYDPYQYDFGITFQAPSMKHWLGTDEMGRDYLTRILYGGRISMQVGLFSVTVAIGLGALIGGISGYYGGWIDNILMRVGEVISSLPFMPFAITISAVLGARVKEEHKLYLIMIIIGTLSWPGLARLIRGQILSLREQEFMQAATALGISDRKKIVKHLLPNTYGYLIVNATLGMAGAIMSESALSFLGLGVAPPVPTWGNLILYARDMYTLMYRPWLWVPPGICIFLAVLSINLIGDALRDAVDPKSNR